jgi:RNA polymerase sigma factor (sigma-70 family)
MVRHGWMRATPSSDPALSVGLGTFRLPEPTIGRMRNIQPSAGDRASPTPRPERTEAELVRLAQLGSAAAFEQLVLRLSADLYRYLAVRLRDQSEARDALQETLAAAWQGLPSLREPARFRAWIVGIAARKAADAARRRARARALAPAPPPRAADSLVELHEALDALPPRFREVLLLRYLLDLSEAEVADALGLRLGTVKSRTARARNALLELLR